MKNLFYIISLFVAILFVSCNNTSKNEQHNNAVSENTQKENNSDYLINATLWVQISAEYRACCYQTWNFGKIALANNLKVANKDKPAAVVFDLDETLLDNSYFEANLIQNKTSYTTENWKKWTDMECATPVPGAVEFVNYINSLGVEVVYISNRRENELESTKRNMQKIGFPKIKDENYYFRTDEKSKSARKNKVAEKYNIVLLVGDNLAEFSQKYEKRNENFNFDDVDNDKDLFGSYYLILPNPMYGDWESLIQNDSLLTPNENRIKMLIGYDKACK